MFNYEYSKLRGRIREKLGTEGKFAEKIGRSSNYVSKVFKNGTVLTQEDIRKAVDVLDIPIDQIGEYFFMHS